MERHPRYGSTRWINNPRPTQPAGLGYVNGDLLFNVGGLPSQSHTAGQGFEIEWISEGGGALQVHHTSEPDRVLWGTVPGRSFVSAALGQDSFEESRGSFAIHDDAEAVCSHQTVERISLAWPSEIFSEHLQPPIAANGLAGVKKIKSLENSAEFIPIRDADGVAVGNRGPCVVVTGCLYADLTLARLQLKILDEFNITDTRVLTNRFPELGPFYAVPESQLSRWSYWKSWLPASVKESRVGVRYWLVFYESREHQLGFSVRLGRPKSADHLGPPSSFASSTVVPSPFSFPMDGFSGILGKGIEPFDERGLEIPDRKPSWLWSEAPVSAFSSSADERSQSVQFKRKSISLEKITEEDRLTDGTFSTTSSPLASLFLSGLQFSELSELASLSREDVEDCFQLPRFNRVQLTYATSREENIFGFGEQFSHFNMKGRRVPILVQEQGIGRGDQPVTALANLVSKRSGGDWHTTYAPVPYYMTSEMRALYLEGYEYAVFDLTQNDAIQLQVHTGSMDGRILHGRTPVEIIERYTASVGRMKELPAWMLKGAIIGMQGGLNAVQDVWKQLRELEVPLAAFWLQDWVGQRKTSVGWQLWWNWEVDRDHYPGWEQLVHEFRTHGIRTLAYCNIFLAPTHDKPNRQRDLLEEAQREGFVVENKMGSPYMIPNTSFDAAMLDLTNPAARTWLKSVLRDMVKTGVRGWMADFGESLPLDASLFSGEDPRIVHNKYPELWAEVNREFAEEWEAEQRELKRQSLISSNGLSKPDEDDDDDDESLVFFMRAGYRGSPRWSTLFWAGDQMVSWQRNDGIKSAVTGLLTGGLCGYSLNHSDIGGYCTVDVPLLKYRRTEELLLRWMELNAFSTIFRTHEGNVPEANSQFFSNERTLFHFARFCKVYRAWEFYRFLLVKEAAATGLPVVRHLFLHYPRDPQVQSFTFEQFLVGTEILVVPVLDKGRSRVKAYFPRADVPESWEHVWTGKVYTSSPHQGLTAWIEAPLGNPAVFTRKGSSIGRQFRENLIREGVR